MHIWCRKSISLLQHEEFGGFTGYSESMRFYMEELYYQRISNINITTEYRKCGTHLIFTNIFMRHPQGQ